jgi:hypothetical protein
MRKERQLAARRGESREIKALSEVEVAKAQQLKDSMKEAAILGAKLVDAERQLDLLFRQGEARDEIAKPLVQQIGQLQAEIRLVHLRAHLEMRKVLTADQINKYKQERGYAAK